MRLWKVCPVLILCCLLVMMELHHDWLGLEETSMFLMLLQQDSEHMNGNSTNVPFYMYDPQLFLPCNLGYIYNKHGSAPLALRNLHLHSWRTSLPLAKVCVVPVDFTTIQLEDCGNNPEFGMEDHVHRIWEIVKPALTVNPSCVHLYFAAHFAVRIVELAKQLPGPSVSVITHFDGWEQLNILGGSLPTNHNCTSVSSMMIVPYTTKYEEINFGAFASTNRWTPNKGEFAEKLARPMHPFFLEYVDASNLYSHYKHFISFIGSVHKFDYGYIGRPLIKSRLQHARLQLLEKRNLAPPDAFVRVSQFDHEHPDARHINLRKCEDNVTFNSDSWLLEAHHLDRGPCQGELPAELAFAEQQHAKFYLCIGGDSPSADRFFHAFYWGGLCVVVTDPEAPLWNFLPFPDIVPYRDMFVSIPLESFVRNPWESIDEATRNMSFEEYTARQELMRKHKRDVLFDVEDSMVATNYLITALSVASQAVQECRQIAHHLQ